MDSLKVSKVNKKLWKKKFQKLSDESRVSRIFWFTLFIPCNSCLIIWFVFPSSSRLNFIVSNKINEHHQSEWWIDHKKTTEEFQSDHVYHHIFFLLLLLLINFISSFLSIFYPINLMMTWSLHDLIRLILENVIYCQLWFQFLWAHFQVMRSFSWITITMINKEEIILITKLHENDEENRKKKETKRCFDEEWTWRKQIIADEQEKKSFLFVYFCLLLSTLDYHEIQWNHVLCQWFFDLKLTLIRWKFFFLLVSCFSYHFYFFARFF